MSEAARAALGGTWFKRTSQGAKALKLALALIDADCDSETAAVMADFNWDTAAKIAGVTTPSSETKAIAVGIIRGHEQLEAEENDSRG